MSPASSSVFSDPFVHEIEYALSSMRRVQCNLAGGAGVSLSSCSPSRPPSRAPSCFSSCSFSQQIRRAASAATLAIAGATLVLVFPSDAQAQQKGPSVGAAQQTLPPESAPPSEPKTKEQLAAQQHFQRAKDHYQTGSYREAIAELEAARALDPKAKDLVFNIGIVEEKLGRFDEAIGHFQKYMEMETVTASERAKAENIIKRIEGAKRAIATSAPASTPTAEAHPETSPPTAPESPRRGRIDTQTIAAGSVAVLGLGIGTVFGLAAVVSKPGSNDFVTGRDGSYRELESKSSSAHTLAIVADVGFGVGIVAAAVTAYLYFSRTKEPTSTAFVSGAAPVLSPSGTLAGGTLLFGSSFR